MSKETMDNSPNEGTPEEVAARMTAEREWPVVVRLTRPVEFGSQSIDSLTFRRGKMGDLKGISLNGVPPADQLMLVASRMCGQPLKVIESIDGDDAAEVLDVALGFFMRCLGAGKKRSR